MERIIQVAIIIIVVVGVWCGLSFLANKYAQFEREHPCIKSHVEIEYRQPMVYNASLGEGSGSIGVPLGNIQQIEKTVCDERA